MIRIENLSLNYGNNKVLDNFNLDLAAGQIIGLVGPNGTGKTTLLRILAGLEMNYHGDVFVENKKIDWMTKSFVAYQPDHLGLEDKLKLKDVMKLHEEFFEDFDSERFKKMVADFNLTMDTRMKEMSKGMRDKVQIASTLSRKAKVYLLDEPMSGVDPSARKKILQVIIDNFDYEGIMIISTHLISQVEKVLDRAIFINKGKVVMNESVDEIRQKQNMGVEEYFEEVF